MVLLNPGDIGVPYYLRSFILLVMFWGKYSSPHSIIVAVITIGMSVICVDFPEPEFHKKIPHQSPPPTKGWRDDDDGISYHYNIK